MLAILFVFAALVLAMLMMFASFSMGGGEEEVPAIFKITSITHDGTKYESNVVLLHTGTVTYNNSNLMAKFYKDDQLIHADILTMHGEDFIPTQHHGVQTMGGEGCSGNTWLPGERIALDFKNKMFHPDDMVTAEIYDAKTGVIISRHSYRA